MDTNKRKFLVVTRVHNHTNTSADEMIRKAIPIESIISVNEFGDCNAQIEYMDAAIGVIRPISVENSFWDIMCGKCTVEL